jgi:hypothetical protein
LQIKIISSQYTETHIKHNIFEKQFNISGLSVYESYLRLTKSPNAFIIYTYLYFKKKHLHKYILFLKFFLTRYIDIHKMQLKLLLS